MKAQPKSSSAQSDTFDQDILDHGGYLYTTNAPLSSRLAHSRISDAIFDIEDFSGGRVIDIGCGDGVYTLGILERGRPTLLHGTDLAQAAVRLARHKEQARSVTFDIASAYHLPFGDDSFDTAHLRAVLHHMESPALAIKEALRVARRLVVAEPNGNNPGVKAFEKLSAYHREHDEKSYSSILLNRWVRQAGGTITRAKWIGLVPTFCPDWLAKATKAVEPFVERLPLLRRIVCSIYVFVAERAERSHGTRP